MELTPEEIALKSYKDLSDERLGQMTRAIMNMIQEPQDDEDKGKLMVAANVNVLINMALLTNSKEIIVTVEGVTIANKAVGNWQVTCKEIKS